MPCVDQPAVKWVSTATFANGTSYTVPRGAQIEEGDLLVIVGANADSAATAQWVAKTGWTLDANLDGVDGPDSAGLALAIYSRRADGTEGEDETVTYGADVGGAFLAYLNLGRKAKVTSPLELGALVIVDDTGAPQTATSNAIAIDEDRALAALIAVAGADGGTGFTVPDDWTSVVDVTGGSGATATSGLVATRPGTDLSIEGETVAPVTVSTDHTMTRGWLVLGLYIRPQCGRPTVVQLEQLLRFLPPDYVEASDLLGGIAAQFAQIEEDGCTLVDLATIGKGIGKWLNLHGSGLGIFRADGELDDTYRERLRRVDDRVTRPAILDTLDTVLETHSAGDDPSAAMLEWFDTPALDIEPFFLDTAGAALSGGAHSFTVVVPDFDNDDSFDDPVYGSLTNTLDTLRAAGVRVYMTLAPETLNTVPNRAGVLGFPFLEVLGDVTSTDRAGFDVLDASNHGILDLARISTSDVKAWAIRFRFDSVPSSDQVILGSDGATGVALWLTSTGGFELRINDGTTTITRSATIPIEVGVDWWVFLQADRRTTPASVAGFIGTGRAGDVNLQVSSTFQPAAGLDLGAVAAEQRLGHNVGTIAGSPNSGADALTILEVREYDCGVSTDFELDETNSESILAGANDRVDRIALRYDGSDDAYI